MQQLVLPKLIWSGHWMRPSEQQLRRWDTAVEKTVLGRHFIGRGRALAWEGIGARFNPTYLIDFCNIRHELWRAKRIAREARDPGTRGTRLQEVLRKWRWERVGDFQYRTEEGGVLDLARDGMATIRQTCERAWLRSLWLQEPRASDERSQRALLQQRAVPPP